MTRLIILLTFYSVIIPHYLLAQSEVLAKIGSKEINKSEFKSRFELSPRILSNDIDDTDSLKLKFLYSLIAEKLWAVEALNNGLAGSDEFNFYYTPVKKSYIRDEVFKNEIKDKAKVSNDDISDGINKHIKTLQVKSVATQDSSEIANFYSLLKNVGSLDSLSSINPDLLQLISTAEIKFGDLNDEVIENRLYQLQVKEFTEPIKNRDIWFIFELENSKLSLPEVSQNKLQNDVIEVIRNRRIRNLYDEFYKKHFTGFSIKADEKLFIEISEAFYEVIISNLNSLQKENISEKYYLSETDIIEVKKKLESEFLNYNLFNTRYAQVKVYEFLSDLTLVDVVFENINQSAINKVLSNELKRFMQQETVYQIGVQMGVQFSEEVKSQLELWRDNLLAQIWKNGFNNKIKVTEVEIEQYYNDSLSDSLQLTNVKLQVINATDLDKVNEILNLIENGKSFNQIAKEFDSNQSVYVENISDLNNLKKYGQSASVIIELDTGQIYGPIKTNDGYSLIKVIEKNTVPDSVKTKIKQQKDNIYRNLFTEKLNNLLEDETIKLANKYGVIQSEDLINTEHYSDVNLFVHKYLGFGGRIAAVPYLAPFYKWFNRWKTQVDKSP